MFDAAIFGRVASLIVSLPLVLAIVCSPVAARDRPGTPTDVSVRTPETHLTKRSRLLVVFRNTATEEVSFWVEWTANGVPQPPKFGVFTECPETSGDNYNCARSYLRTERGGKLEAAGRTDNRDHPFAFYVPEVDFDTEYCFRFMAQDEDGVISEIWSAWACHRTPRAPELPERPQIEHVTVLPGRTGDGEMGGRVPDRVLVEWTRESRGAADYVVEQLFDDSRWLAVGDPVSPRGEPWEAAVNVDKLPTMEKPVRYRLCARNFSGKSCSDSVSTKTYAADGKVDSSIIEKPADAADAKVESDAIKAPPGGEVVAPKKVDSNVVEKPFDAADTKVESGVVQERPPDVIREAPAPAPSAEGRRRGPLVTQ